jgi:hypothetical protein
MSGDAEAPPPAQPQVVYIVQSAMREERTRSLKEDYATKAATVLGSLHLLCGLITLIASIVGIDENGGRGRGLESGLVFSAFFLLSGGLTIAGARSGNRCPPILDSKGGILLICVRARVKN